ncbi:MAG TPA: methyltransferase domain-containing protein [Nitrososphaera sp.]|nr:methyltransferase domain-containing protein [Nitrososphaera sp.]
MHQPPSFDPEQFKQAQRQAWGRTAGGMKTWWPVLEEGYQKLSDKLVELAGVRPGSKVLDVATGIGEPAVTAARRVEPNGKLLATDISPEMLEIGRERAEKLGLQHIIEFRESDAESLKLPDKSFDAVLCRMGLMFLPNLSLALRLFHNALVPNGKIAAAVMPSLNKVPIVNLAFLAVLKKLNLPQPSHDTPPFHLSDPLALQNALIKAGFQDVKTENMVVTLRVDSPDSFTNYHKAVSAPIHALLAGQTAEKQNETWQAVTEAARSHTNSKGEVVLDNEVICCVGTRAS